MPSHPEQAALLFSAHCLLWLCQIHEQAGRLNNFTKMSPVQNVNPSAVAATQARIFIRVERGHTVFAPADCSVLSNIYSSENYSYSIIARVSAVNYSLCRGQFACDDFSIREIKFSWLHQQCMNNTQTTDIYIAGVNANEVLLHMNVGIAFIKQILSFKNKHIYLNYSL